MKEQEKIEAMKDRIIEARRNLGATGNMIHGTQSVLNLLVDYVEFMLTPAEIDDE